MKPSAIVATVSFGEKISGVRFTYYFIRKREKEKGNPHSDSVSQVLGDGRDRCDFRSA